MGACVTWPMSRGSCHMLRALQTPVLVPEPHRKAVLSPLAGKQSKASTEIGTQMHLTQNFALCTDLSAGGKTYFSSVLALGKQGRPWEGSPGLPGTEPEWPPEGGGQRQGSCRQARVQGAPFAQSPIA